MNKKPGLRAALYARFSSDLQRSESIDAQVRAMKKYCIERGMYLDDIFVRLDELETKKQELQEEIAKKVKMRDVQFSDDDIDNTISQCKQLLKQPTNPANRDFIKKAVVKIVVYRDEVLVVLNTGLSVNDEFNTEIKFTNDMIRSFIV